MKRSPLVITALILLAAAAHAGQITYNGVGLAGTADISYNSGAASWVYSGYLNFTGGTNLGFVNNNFTSICGDVLDNISPGNSYGAVAWDSQAYASFSGNAKIGLAGNIIAKNFATATADADHAKALQLAVWEVLYDANPLDFSAGIFRAKEHGNATWGAGFSSNVLNLATTYYNDQSVTGTAVFIKAAAGSGGQDQFTMQDMGEGHYLTTPEPFTMSLGFAGIGLFVRRRLKAKKA